MQQPLKVIKNGLIGKHVAEEIVKKIYGSVVVSFEGKKIGTCSCMRSTAQAALEEALLHILTFETPINIWKDVFTAKEQGKPYVIIFVGTDGVDKSTNLVKVAYWLLEHDVSVIMVARDAFWPSTVEQPCNDRQDSIV